MRSQIATSNAGRGGCRYAPTYSPSKVWPCSPRCCGARPPSPNRCRRQHPDHAGRRATPCRQLLCGDREEAGADLRGPSSADCAAAQLKAPHRVQGSRGRPIVGLSAGRLDAFKHRPVMATRSFLSEPWPRRRRAAVPTFPRRRRALKRSQGLEWLCKLGLGDLVVNDIEPREKGLIPLALGVVTGRRIALLERLQRVERHVEDLPDFVARRGFSAVLAARLTPGVPSTALHYMDGASPVGARAFSEAFAVGAILRTVPYAVLGEGIGSGSLATPAVAAGSIVLSGPLPTAI